MVQLCRDLGLPTPGLRSHVVQRLATQKAAYPLTTALPLCLIQDNYHDTVLSELKQMEESGIIEKSSSEWAAPIVLVRKEDELLHMCVDYRHLNTVTPVDAYPMSRIDDLVDQLGKDITTLDLSRGYWQVP